MATFGEAVAGGQAILLDGGLATQLEARGHDLSDTLWSARLLLEDPDEVRAAHADFFAAGAQVATTASYQVSASGFVAAGPGRDNAELALRRSVQLAREAASAAATDGAWVAASGRAVRRGPGERFGVPRRLHGLSVTELRAWHPRLEIPRRRGRRRPRADDPVPRGGRGPARGGRSPRRRGVAVAHGRRAGIVPAAVRSSGAADSRSVDGSLDVEATTSDLEALSLPTTRFGEPIAQAYAMAADVPGVVAVGANCFDPALVAGVAHAARPFGHAVIAYPNSGELTGRRRPHLDRRAHDRRRGRRHLACRRSAPSVAAAASAPISSRRCARPSPGVSLLWRVRGAAV